MPFEWRKVAELSSLATFYGLIFAIGVMAQRKRRSAGGVDEWMLAGRQMPLVIGIFTLTATWVGGGYINGTAEAVYDTNLGLVWAQAPWGYALSLILGGLVFARRLRRLGLTTLLDLFEMRYGRRVAALLYTPALLGEVFWSAAILVALGTTCGTVLGLDVTTAIVVSAAIAIGYTLVGGLWSVAYTDVAQLLCILFGLGVALPFAASHAGGLGTAVSDYVRDMPPFPQGRALFPWADMALLLIFGGIPWQVYIQRLLAMPTERASVGLSVGAGFCCALMAVPAVLIGMVGRTVDWSLTAAPAPPEPALVLPYVLRYLTNPFVATIGLAAIAAAVMSSIDSSILSASSMFAWNIYRPLSRTHDDLRIRRVLRLAVVAIGLVTTVLAVVVGRVYVLWFLCSDLVYVILFPQLLSALYDRRANRHGALAGAGVGLFLRLGGGEPLLGLPGFLPFPWQTPDGTQFPFRTFAMLCGLLTISVVSRWTGSAGKRGRRGSTEP